MPGPTGWKSRSAEASVVSKVGRSAVLAPRVPQLVLEFPATVAFSCDPCGRLLELVGEPMDLIVKFVDLLLQRRLRHRQFTTTRVTSSGHERLVLSEDRPRSLGSIRSMGLIVASDLYAVIGHVIQPLPNESRALNH